jgi:hypothetical protein
MRTLRHLSIAAFAVMSVCSLAAQSNPGTILQLEFQKPKNGMLQQYEDGRKQKAAWHKQQNDKTPLLVWQVISGDDTNTYIVGEPPQHWVDLDKPSIPEEQDLAEYNKVIGNNVESLIIRFYEFLPKISRPPDSQLPLKYEEVIAFHVKYGKGMDFQKGVSRVTEAATKTNWPMKFEWYHLANGGSGDEWVLVLPHDNWAGFGDMAIKPVHEMVAGAFGESEAKALFDGFNDMVVYETTSIIQFRPDLSYIPGK